MRNLVFILFLLASLAGYPQHRADIWYFGNKAGIDFNSGKPLPVYGSEMIAEVGCATICDTNGQLLFYTNGREVWDRQNNPMPNGDSLNGGTDFINQNSLVIPDPGNSNGYYLFTIDTLSAGLCFSKIDMALNSGFGDITVKNQTVLEDVAGKLTSVNHCNSKFIWVITRKMNTPSFYSYLVTDTGVLYSDPVISVAGDNILADIGMMKASPAGDMLAVPINTTNVYLELFDFDNTEGIVSNPRKIYKTEEIVYVYGVEFSGDGKFLYISTGGKDYQLFQYDLTLNSEKAINESAVVISTGNNYSLQLGPDSKIYSARVNDNYLNVIDYPSRKGEECSFSEKEVYLGDNICLMGLPNYNQSYFYFPSYSFSDACIGDSTSLWLNTVSNIDSVRWTVNSSGIDTIVKTPPFKIRNVFEYAGDHSVNMKIFHCNATDSVSGILSVHRAPDINLGNDTVICEGSFLTLEANDGMDRYLWNTGDDANSIMIWDSGTYWVEVSKNGCSDSDTIKIFNIPADVQLPTAFSPNGDGVNDRFIPRVSGVVSGFQIEIFNRSGREVWQNDDPNRGWDGKYNGIKCSPEMYVWQMKYVVLNGEKSESVEKAGNVVLIR